MKSKQHKCSINARQNTSGCTGVRRVETAKFAGDERTLASAGTGSSASGGNTVRTDGTHGPSADSESGLVLIGSRDQRGNGA